MANKVIWKKFYEGVHKVYSTMFSYGIEGEDGILLFLLQEDKRDVYGEQRNKMYHPPVALIARVEDSVVEGNANVERQKRKCTFNVPIKSLNDAGIYMTKDTLDYLKSAVIMYNDIYYDVDRIQGFTFVEDTFMVYKFFCTEVEDSRNIRVEESSDGDV